MVFIYDRLYFFQDKRKNTEIIEFFTPIALNKQVVAWSDSRFCSKRADNNIVKHICKPREHLRAVLDYNVQKNRLISEPSKVTTQF